MPFSDDDFDAARLSLLAASFDPGTWPEAMAWIGKAGGGWASQVVGFSKTRGLTSHWSAGLSADMLDGLQSYDWLDPDLNPRCRMLSMPSSFRVVDDYDLATPQELARNEIYNDFFSKVDGVFVGLAKFDAIDDISIAALSIRSGRAGPPDAKDKAAFGSLLPHLRAAVRTQTLFEAKTTAILTGSLEAVGLAAYLCTVDGKIMGSTPSGEAEIRRRTFFTERNGYLGATENRTDVALRQAVELAGRRPPLGRASTVVIPASTGEYRIADVIPLPSGRYSTGSGAVTIVAVNQVRRRDDATILRGAFGLTAAEAHVALRMACGETIADIADHRRASDFTVRTQVKKIMEKLAVATQGQAIAKILGLTGQPINGDE